MRNFADMLKNKWFWGLAVVLSVLFLPWLGETLFNTKGEPREAIVALSMVQSGNYILPVSMGADIAYKPPMLPWLIVASSWLTGAVDEYASRLPSALACIAMCLTVFGYIAPRRGTMTALVTALVTATSFEVFRAASACRVDMVLTCFVVTAVIALMARREKAGRPAFSVAAVLLMSGAVLTKGPVGALLPCLAAGVAMLLRRDRLWPVAGWLALTAAASLVLPAVWYFAAWRAGGDVFLDLALEENVGRFLGRMSYDSHVNPFYYNFITLIAGMAPYTLLALMATACIRRPRRLRRVATRRWWDGLDWVTLTALVTTVVIFMFYCIPKSKRSVYLLPIYPFVAYFVTLLLRWLVARRSAVVKVYAGIIGILATVPAIVGGLLLLTLDNPSLTAGLKPATAAMVTSLADAFTRPMAPVMTFLALMAGAGTLATLRGQRYAASHIAARTLGATVMLYVALSSAILPAVLNVKSDRAVVADIERIVPAGQPVYMWLSDPMLRYYTINFYTGDRCRLYELPEGSATLRGTATPVPAEGYMLIGDDDLPRFAAAHPGVELTPALTPGRRSCDTRRTFTLQHFITRK